MPKGKAQVLNFLNNTYCRLRPSKISAGGVGVFAIRDIPKNKKIFLGQINERWYKFNMADLKKLDKEILKMIDDFFVIEPDGSIKIPASGLNGMDMSFYVNNSNKPNAKTSDNGFTFMSLREIKKGEEITVAYSSYDHKY